MLIGIAAGLSRHVGEGAPIPSLFQDLGLLKYPSLFLAGAVGGTIVMVVISFLISPILHVPYTVIHMPFVQDAYLVLVGMVGYTLYGMLAIKVLDAITHYADRPGIILTSSLICGNAIIFLSASPLPRIIVVLLTCGYCGLCGGTFFLSAKLRQAKNNIMTRLA